MQALNDVISNYSNSRILSIFYFIFPHKANDPYFKLLHEQEFGFNFTARQILIDNIRVRSIGFTQTIT